MEIKSAKLLHESSIRQPRRWHPRLNPSYVVSVRPRRLVPCDPAARFSHELESRLAQMRVSMRASFQIPESLAVAYAP